MLTLPTMLMCSTSVHSATDRPRWHTVKMFSAIQNLPDVRRPPQKVVLTFGVGHDISSHSETEILGRLRAWLQLSLAFVGEHHEACSTIERFKFG